MCLDWGRTCKLITDKLFAPRAKSNLGRCSCLVPLIQLRVTDVVKPWRCHRQDLQLWRLRSEVKVNHAAAAAKLTLINTLQFHHYPCDLDAYCSVSMETISILLMLIAAFSQFTNWWGESQRRTPDGTKAEDHLRIIWLQRASRVMKWLRGKQWTGADHVYSVKCCEITEHGPGPPRSRLCICQFACFHCVCVQTWRLTVRDRVRFKSFEIPAFLWGILSVIYLSWALWARTSNYKAELKAAYSHRVSESDWRALLRYYLFFLLKEKLLSVIYLCCAFRFLDEVLSAHIFMLIFNLETTLKKSQKSKW